MGRRVPIFCRNDEEKRQSIIQHQKPSGFETLWRYMSIEKFVHMMLTKTLFIPKIGLFDDRREGGFIEEIFNRLYGSIDPKLGRDAFRRAQDRFYALCFHGLDCENELMWRGYAPLGGVALMTSAAKLMSAQFELDELDAASREYYFLRVAYGDKFRERIHPIAVKQKEYRPESEFRMIFAAKSPNVRTNLSGSTLPGGEKSGLLLHFRAESMQSFISEIRLSPNNTRIVEDIVRRLLDISGCSEDLAVNRSNIQR